MSLKNSDPTVREAEAPLQAFRGGKGTVGKLLNDPTLYNEANETITKLRRISDQMNDQIGSGKGTIGKLLKDEELYNRTNSLNKRREETSARLERVRDQVERGKGKLGKPHKAEQHNEEARVQ